MATYKELNIDPRQGFWVSKVWHRDYTTHQTKSPIQAADPTEDKYQAGPSPPALAISIAPVAR